MQKAKKQREESWNILDSTAPTSRATMNVSSMDFEFTKNWLSSSLSPASEQFQEFTHS